MPVLFEHSDFLIIFHGYMGCCSQEVSMAYNELIKNFGRIRDYMRDFYVYGFKSRIEYDAKSARSYDNERRRIESWLADYMSFRHEASGKNVFISVDCRMISHNPLYNAFKAKTFTDNDINLHFYLMDILDNSQLMSVQELVEKIGTEYLSCFAKADALDESTVRKKLKEYEELGLVCTERQGKQLLYSRAENKVDLGSWKNAVPFFSEVEPIGVIGSYIIDKYQGVPDYFSFKHHYILHALESEILYSLLYAIRNKVQIEVETYRRRRGRPTVQLVTPVQIFVSVQNGRSYLASYNHRFKKVMLFRLDSIKKVTPKETDMEFDKHAGFVEQYKSFLWGVSAGVEFSPDHIEMIIHMEYGEEFILKRLAREKRCGSVEKVDNTTCRFTADVYDAAEMLPWLRTFIGRIQSIECSNPYVAETFNKDLREIAEMYGVSKDAVQ
jgi:DNA-binding transcriptional ArsR family regulator